jgi:xanthine dehydrogenase accessory factor
VTTDREIALGLVAALDEGLAAVMATVTRTNRSVPRHAGAKMLVYSDGRQLGTIGGGEMEARVREASAELITTGQSTNIDYDLLDPARGDPGVCGGSVSVHLEVFMPQPHLVVVGCGHVGAAVVELAHWLGYRVTAVDDRLELAHVDRLADADVVLSGRLEDSLHQAGIDERTHVVLLTRNVGVDVEVLPLVISSPALSIGVMGSARRWQTTRAKLLEAGVAEDQLDRVVSPIGLDIAAETPAEIALSIMTELVDLRRRESAPQ